MYSSAGEKCIFINIIKTCINPQNENGLTADSRWGVMHRFKAMYWNLTFFLRCMHAFTCRWRNYSFCKTKSQTCINMYPIGSFARKDMNTIVITPVTFIHLDRQALLQMIKGVSYRAAVAFQVSTQANGSGGLKRLSARGGAAYGIPRNRLIFLHSEPTRITWDLPIRSPWDGMYTDGVKSNSEMGRNKSIREGTEEK